MTTVGNTSIPTIQTANNPTPQPYNANPQFAPYTLIILGKTINDIPLGEYNNFTHPIGDTLNTIGTYSERGRNNINQGNQYIDQNINQNINGNDPNQQTSWGDPTPTPVIYNPDSYTPVPSPAELYNPNFNTHILNDNPNANQNTYSDQYNTPGLGSPYFGDTPPGSENLMFGGSSGGGSTFGGSGSSSGSFFLGSVGGTGSVQGNLAVGGSSGGTTFGGSSLGGSSFSSPIESVPYTPPVPYIQPPVPYTPPQPYEPYGSYSPFQPHSSDGYSPFGGGGSWGRMGSWG